MPQLADLQKRSPPQEKVVGGESEELLVVDDRGGLTPAQMVEQKLVGLLKASSPGASDRASQGDLPRRPSPRAEGPAPFVR
jgi:hypothetical protein